MRVRHIVLATSCGLAVASLASPALAEGAWHSYLDKVLPGFDSRTWRDGDIDANSTNIGFTNCYGTAQSGHVQLTREKPWYMPDENRGVKHFWACSGGRSQIEAYGRQPSGSYHFTVVDVFPRMTGGRANQLSVSSVDVWY